MLISALVFLFEVFWGHTADWMKEHGVTSLLLWKNAAPKKSNCGAVARGGGCQQTCPSPPSDLHFNKKHIPASSAVGGSVSVVRVEAWLDCLAVARKVPEIRFAPQQFYHQLCVGTLCQMLACLHKIKCFLRPVQTFTLCYILFCYHSTSTTKPKVPKSFALGHCKVLLPQTCQLFGFYILPSCFNSSYWRVEVKLPSSLMRTPLSIKVKQPKCVPHFRSFTHTSMDP